MNTAVNTSTERANSTQAVARHGQKNGQANRGKAEANNLFAEVLSTSGGLRAGDPMDTNSFRSETPGKPSKNSNNKKSSSQNTIENNDIKLTDGFLNFKNTAAVNSLSKNNIKKFAENGINSLISEKQVLEIPSLAIHNFENNANKTPALDSKLQVELNAASSNNWPGVIEIPTAPNLKLEDQIPPSPFISTIVTAEPIEADASVTLDRTPPSGALRDTPNTPFATDQKLEDQIPPSPINSTSFAAEPIEADASVTLDRTPPSGALRDTPNTPFATDQKLEDQIPPSPFISTSVTAEPIASSGMTHSPEAPIAKSNLTLLSAAPNIDAEKLEGIEAPEAEILETAAPKNTATPKDTHTQGPNHAEKEPVATVGKAVSAAAKVAGRVLPPPQALTQAMGLDAAATQAWHMSIPGNPGNRLQAATAETSPAASPETAVESGPAGQGLSISRNASQDASAGGKGEGGTNLLLDDSQHETLGTADADSNASSSFATSLGEAMGDAFQNLGTQVSYWASQNVKRASINLDIGTDQALQVEVTLDGDKAQLDFRTNDASARVALQNNAEQVLNDLLARSGLGLAGFSVGSQAHQSAQQNPHPSHSAPKGHANQFVKTSEAESITAQRWTPRSTSSVDIYA